MTARIQPSAIVAAIALAASQGALAQATSPAPDASAVESIVIQGSFLNSGAQSAMKLDAPVLDTPFSVSNYSDSFMKAIETTSVADMYNYMVGIKRAGNTGYDIVVRGMKSGVNDRNSILVDGLPGLAGRFGSPPTVAQDHIELVKGPMSVLYGQAQPGGFINLVSKKPKSTRANEIDVKGTGFIGHGLSLADASGGEISIDSTGPVDAGKKFLYRFVGQTASRDGFRTGTHDKSLYLSPSVTWSLADTTLLTAIFEFRKTRIPYDSQLIFPNNEPRRVADIRTRYQEPDDYQKELGKSLSLQFEHTFANDAKWSAQTRSSRGGDQSYGYDAVASVAPYTVVQRRARGQYNQRRFDFGDTNLAIPLKTGSLAHKVLLGISGGRETADLDRTQFFTGVCPSPASSGVNQCFDIDFFNPVYGAVPSRGALPLFTGAATSANRQHRYTASRSLGAYASDLMTFNEHWKASFALRSARETQSIQELRTVQANGQLPGIPSKVSNRVLPMAGLLYQPTPQTTLYASYSTSYVPAPASSQDANGTNPFKPESSRQIEFGVKAEDLWNHRLTGTLGLFRINKDDALSTYGAAQGCPAAIVTCTRQVNKERSEGIELELNARLLENWQLTAGYAYTDARVVASSADLAPFQVGQQLTNVARNAANVWSRYDIVDGALRGFGLGVGVNYTGSRNGPLPTAADTPAAPSGFTLPAYTVADLGLYYTVDRYAFTLKVGNVFDKVFYESSGSSGNTQIAPGAPRNVALSMRVHF